MRALIRLSLKQINSCLGFTCLLTRGSHKILNLRTSMVVVTDSVDYISSATSSEIHSQLYRISNRTFESSERALIFQFLKFHISGTTWSSKILHVRILRIWEHPLYIFVTLGAIVPYNKTMEQCRLGYDHLHVIPSPPEDQLPPDYVVVNYSCPCGEFRTQFALHLLLLCHLMGTQGLNMGGPEARRYLRILSNLQQEALDAIRNEMNEVEESPDR